MRLITQTLSKCECPEGQHLRALLKPKKHSWFAMLFVVQLLSRVSLCDPVDCSTPGLPVPHYLLEFAHVRGAGDAIQPSPPLTLSSSCLQSFPASGSFPVSQLTSGGQSSDATIRLNFHSSLQSREGLPGRPVHYHRLPKPVHFSLVRKKSSA